MTTVFHERPYGTFIERKSSLRKKKLHRTNHTTRIFLKVVLEHQSVQRRKIVPAYYQITFSGKKDPSIFTPIATELLNRSNKTSWVFPALKSTSHILLQSIVSRKSDSNSEANSCWCQQKSDAWSHLRVLYAMCL